MAFAGAVVTVSRLATIGRLVVGTVQAYRTEVAIDQSSMALPEGPVLRAGYRRVLAVTELACAGTLFRGGERGTSVGQVRGSTRC